MRFNSIEFRPAISEPDRLHTVFLIEFRPVRFPAVSHRMSSGPAELRAPAALYNSLQPGFIGFPALPFVFKLLCEFFVFFL
jgi:hypothetical protein